MGSGEDAIFAPLQADGAKNQKACLQKRSHVRAAIILSLLVGLWILLV